MSKLFHSKLPIHGGTGTQTSPSWWGPEESTDGENTLEVTRKKAANAVQVCDSSHVSVLDRKFWVSKMSSVFARNRMASGEGSVKESQNKSGILKAN